MVLRTINVQVSQWEAILPEEGLGLPAEVVRVGALLADPAFVVPFAAHFGPMMGRPSMATENVSAADAPQAPLRAGLRDAVPRGRRLDLVAAVLPPPPSAGACLTRRRW